MNPAAAEVWPQIVLEVPSNHMIKGLVTFQHTSYSSTLSTEQ